LGHLGKNVPIADAWKNAFAIAIGAFSFDFELCSVKVFLDRGMGKTYFYKKWFSPYKT